MSAMVRYAAAPLAGGRVQSHPERRLVLPFGWS
jgi:hypothetical protein